MNNTAEYGTMRRMNIVLLALLQLGETRSRGFSIHEDLLAFPQVGSLGNAVDD